MADTVRVIKGSRLVALGALALSLASSALFMVGVSGDPHEGPFWLAFFALLWPVFLCPLSCLSVVVFLLFERQQPLARRLVTLTIVVSAGILPWLPGIISLKLWLSPERALRDSSPTVRSRGAEALAKRAGPAVVAALTRALKDPADDVRLNASVGLWNQGPEAAAAVPALLDALDDPLFGVGKRGTVVIPAKLRRKFGIGEGATVLFDEGPDGVIIRPAVTVPVEVWTPERRAAFLLENAVDRKDYAWACREVRRMGIDPGTIPHGKPRS